MNFDELDIIVVANKRKEILTTHFLKNIPHRVFYTMDYEIDDLLKDKINKSGNKWIPETAMLGAYRCFRGHIDAINSSTKERILLFEDDAIITNDNWINIVENLIPMLNSFDVINLHMRLYRENCCLKIFYNSIELLVPDRNRLLDNGENLKKDKDKFFGVAALSYLVKNDIKRRLSKFSFMGIPYDILLWKEFKTCFLKNSPFLHDRRMGSLVENRRIVI